MALKLFLPLLFVVQLSTAFSQITPPAKFATPRVADSLYFLKQYKRAVVAYEEFIPTKQVAPITKARLGYSYHKVGDYKNAQRWYDIVNVKPPPPVRPFLFSRMAMTYAIQKMNDKALVALDSAVTNYYSNVVELETDSDFKYIRNADKFKELYKRAFINAYPCTAIPAARQFDFWVGEWEVFNNANNVLVGYNKIENVSGGCNILENWTANPGVFSGKSFNWYDTTAKKWNQLWIGSGGGVTKYENGEYKDGAMRFTYQQTDAKGIVQPGNFIFYNLSPDKVRQYQEISTDGGQNFRVVYDFIYIRKKAKGKS